VSYEEERPDETASDADKAAETADEGQDETEEKKPEPELAPEARALCKAAIEAMLFSSAEPLSTRKLAEPLKDTGIDGRGARKIVRELARDYEEQRRGLAIDEVAGGFQMVTRPQVAEYVAALHGGASRGRLSQAALETLAVVAYKQPVGRADIEAIRGVQAGPLLRSLLQKGLIRITGRAEVIGRPLLYGTTRKFLEHFGLKSLNELPRVDELPRP
jgi:segregation and condensation protein B